MISLVAYLVLAVDTVLLFLLIAGRIKPASTQTGSHTKGKTKLNSTHEDYRESYSIDNDLARVKTELTATKQNLEQLAGEVAALRQQLRNKPTPPAPSLRHEQQVVNNIPTAPPTTRTVYVQNTNNPDGFADEELKEQPTRFVKFEMIVNGDNARFNVLNNPDIQERLLNSIGDIEEFVEKENESNGATRIITMEPGTAKLVGGCWMVKTKAKIRFEK